MLISCSKLVLFFLIHIFLKVKIGLKQSFQHIAREVFGKSRLKTYIYEQLQKHVFKYDI